MDSYVATRNYFYQLLRDTQDREGTTGHTPPATRFLVWSHRAGCFGGGVGFLAHHFRDVKVAAVHGNSGRQGSRKTSWLQTSSGETSTYLVSVESDPVSGVRCPVA